MNFQRTNHYRCSHARRIRGVGIIEVLIALVVVSFGVLGMAGLQLTGMKHSNGGYNRAKAVLLAENMVARMRANSVAVEAGDYAAFDSSTEPTDYCDTKPAAYCAAYKSVNADSCTTTEMATYDLFSIACGNWSEDDKAEDGVLNSLNNGRLTVDCLGTCAPNFDYEVSITWDENNVAAKDEAVNSTKRVQVRFNP